VRPNAPRSTPRKAGVLLQIIAIDRSGRPQRRHSEQRVQRATSRFSALDPQNPSGSRCKLGADCLQAPNADASRSNILPHTGADRETSHVDTARCPDDDAQEDLCSMFRLIPSLLAAALLAAPQMASAYELLPKKLASLSPQDFAQKMLLEEDPLDPVVTLSTQHGYTHGRSIEGAYANDVHLRASVDRNTGRVTWQVWHELINVRGHKNVVAIHYWRDGMMASAHPLTVDRWLDQCPPMDSVGFCNQFTRVAFELPEDVVREVAASYRAGSREPWRLHFKDKSGQDVTGGLAPAEVAGLVQALDSWRIRRARQVD